MCGITNMNYFVPLLYSNYPTALLKIAPLQTTTTTTTILSEKLYIEQNLYILNTNVTNMFFLFKE